MPWTAADAEQHTASANTEEKRAVWAEAANKALRDGRSEEVAIRIGNGAVRRMTAGGSNVGG